MPNILEDVQLTDTTTSYRVQLDYVDLRETLDESYERNRALHEEQKRLVDESGDPPLTANVPLKSAND